MFVFVHLLNDLSGSPKVLSEVIDDLTQTQHIGANSVLYVGSGTNGFLDSVDVSIKQFWYRRSRFRIVTLVTYLISQLILMIKLFRDKSIEKEAIIYINTLLPFGAALFGLLTRRRVIYHLHEVSLSPKVLLRSLVFIAKSSAAKLIYVSDYHQQALPIPRVPQGVVYNSLELRWFEEATSSMYQHRTDEKFRVVMIASPRDYKGIPELLLVANALIDRSDIVFDLILNAEPAEFSDYLGKKSVPKNVHIQPRLEDTSKVYSTANLVMNLSRIDEWVETFGLTILEAMAHGVPVICPPMGGPTELVEDGFNGYLVDSRDTPRLKAKILELADDEVSALQMSLNARKRAELFSPDAFSENLRKELETLNV